jgi:hypothetical protein
MFILRLNIEIKNMGPDFVNTAKKKGKKFNGKERNKSGERTNSKKY